MSSDTGVDGVRWLLDCEPRPAQIEALARSYTGVRYRDHKDDEPVARPLPHAGQPAAGWGHFMEMRVGKTPTALNEALLFKADYGVKKSLFIAHSKYKHKWGLEMDTFGFDSPHHVFESDRRKDADKFVAKSGESALIINYEALIYKKTMQMLEDYVDSNTMIVADESVMIKSNDSIMFKNSLFLSKQAGVTRALTGLPAPQGPQDLWAQLRFCKRLEGVNYYSFKSRFCEVGGFKGKIIKGIKNPEDLEAMLESFTFRGRRADWGTKIDSDYEVVKLAMTPEQQRAYKEMEEDFVTFINDDMVTAGQVLTKRMKMQQISSGFIYNENREPLTIVPFEKTPKFKDFYERLTTESSGKLFVVAIYNHTVRELYRSLAEFNPAMVAGDVHMKKLGKDTEAEKLRFNTDPACRVLVAQEKSIKYGATLMGTKEDPVLDLTFYENSYSLDDRSQTEERPQGEGQMGPLHITDYFSSGVERDVVMALQKKTKISAAIMKYYGKPMARGEDKIDERSLDNW